MSRQEIKLDEINEQLCTIHVVSKSVTAKDLRCKKCKKHGVIKLIDKSECTYCGNVC